VFFGLEVFSHRSGQSREVLLQPTDPTPGVTRVSIQTGFKRHDVLHAFAVLVERFLEWLRVFRIVVLLIGHSPMLQQRL
jgi:hypothetical protein